MGEILPNLISDAQIVARFPGSSLRTVRARQKTPYRRPIFPHVIFHGSRSIYDDERILRMLRRSAVNFSFFLCAACRTRSSACDTRSRPCVRCVLCWLAFPLAPALGSTGSAAVGTALFVGFPATMAESDFSRPCIIGYGSSPSRCGPAAVAERSSRDLPVPAQGASAHARVSDHAGSSGRSR